WARERRGPREELVKPDHVRVCEKLQRFGLVLEERAELGLEARLRLELVQGERDGRLLSPRAGRIPEERGEVDRAHRSGAQPLVDHALAVAAVDLEPRAEHPGERARGLEAPAARAYRHALRQAQVAGDAARHDRAV